MVGKCCFVGCNNQAEFIITARRSDGSYAGPDPYSDDTLACENHVGQLLGWQPDAENTDEIEWVVQQWQNQNSIPSTDLTTAGR